MWWLALALAAEPAAVEAQRGGSLTVDDLFPPCARTYAVTKRPFADARASSSLSEGSMTHGPSRAVDGDPATAWVEGVKGAGVGETLRVAVPGGVGLPAGLWVLPGYAKDAARWGKNHRVAQLEVRFLKAPEGVDPAKAWAEDALVPTDTGPLRVSFQQEDGRVPQEGQGIDLGMHFHQNMESTEVVALELAIVATDGAGASYEDTCISEVAELILGAEQSVRCAQGWCDGPGQGHPGCP